MAEHRGGLYRNIYPKICARVRVDLDGFNLLTFAIVFPVPGGFADHNLFSQPALIWFFKITESGARLLKKERKDGRHDLSHLARAERIPPLVVDCGITISCTFITEFKLENICIFFVHFLEIKMT